MQKISAKKAFSLIELSIVILIIGIIIAGVTQGSRLVAKMRLSTAQSQTKSSPVSSIKDLAVWLEATSEESFADSETEEGSLITTWHDINPQSSIKNNFTNTSVTDADHPTYKISCINNLPCVQFDGVAQYIDSTQNLGTTQQLSIFLVLFALDNDGVDTHSVLGTPGAWSQDSSFQLKRQNTYFYQLPANDMDLSGSGITPNKADILSIVDAYTSGKIFINGGTPIQDLPESTATKSLAALNLGSWDDHNGVRDNWFDGSIGELIIFRRALKNEERQSVESYLSKKWNIKLSN